MPEISAPDDCRITRPGYHLRTRVLPVSTTVVELPFGHRIPGKSKSDSCLDLLTSEEEGCPIPSVQPQGLARLTG